MKFWWVLTVLAILCSPAEAMRGDYDGGVWDDVREQPSRILKKFSEHLIKIGQQRGEVDELISKSCQKLNRLSKECLAPGVLEKSLSDLKEAQCIDWGYSCNNNHMFNSAVLNIYRKSSKESLKALSRSYFPVQMYDDIFKCNVLSKDDMFGFVDFDSGDSRYYFDNIIEQGLLSSSSNRRTMLQCLFERLVINKIDIEAVDDFLCCFPAFSLDDLPLLLELVCLLNDRITFSILRRRIHDFYMSDKNDGSVFDNYNTAKVLMLLISGNNLFQLPSQEHDKYILRVESLLSDVEREESFWEDVKLMSYIRLLSKCERLSSSRFEKFPDITKEDQVGQYNYMGEQKPFLWFSHVLDICKHKAKCSVSSYPEYALMVFEEQEGVSYDLYHAASFLSNWGRSLTDVQDIDSFIEIGMMFLKRNERTLYDSGIDDPLIILYTNILNKAVYRAFERNNYCDLPEIIRLWDSKELMTPVPVATTLAWSSYVQLIAVLVELRTIRNRSETDLWGFCSLGAKGTGVVRKLQSQAGLLFKLFYRYVKTANMRNVIGIKKQEKYEYSLARLKHHMANVILSNPDVINTSAEGVSQEDLEFWRSYGVKDKNKERFYKGKYFQTENYVAYCQLTSKYGFSDEFIEDWVRKPCYKSNNLEESIQANVINMDDERKFDEKIYFKDYRTKIYRNSRCTRKSGPYSLGNRGSQPF